MKACFIATLVIAFLFTGVPGTGTLLGVYTIAHLLIG